MLSSNPRPNYSFLLLVTPLIILAIFVCMGVFAVHLNDRINWRSYFSKVETFGDRCAYAVQSCEDAARIHPEQLTYKSHHMPYRGTENPPRAYPGQCLVTRCTAIAKLGVDSVTVSLGVLFGHSTVFVNGRLTEIVNVAREVKFPVALPSNPIEITVISKGDDDGIVGMGSLIPPYVSHDTAGFAAVQRYLGGAFAEQAAFQVGLAGTILFLLLVLWLNGFKYPDVVWVMILAAWLCIYSGGRYFETIFRDTTFLDRLPALTGFGQAAASLMFLLSFLRIEIPKRWTLTILLGSMGIGLCAMGAPSPLYFTLRLRSMASTIALALCSLALFVLLLRQQSSIGRERRKRFVTWMSGVLCVTCITQVLVEDRYAVDLTIIYQLGVLLFFTTILLKDLIARQGQFLEERQLRILKEQEAAHALSVTRIAQAVVHDIMRPFRMVRVVVNAMQRNPEADNILTMLPLVEDAEESVRCMIQNVLDENVENRRVESAEVSGQALVHKAISLVGLFSGEAKKISLQVKFHDKRLWNVGKWPLMRVLQNVLENAVQASPSGGEIAVHVTRASIGLNCIEIHNTGSWIDPADASQIFEEHFSRTVGGSGFGLASARRIVNQHGGEITFSSNPHKGTTFFITVPVSQREDSTPEYFIDQFPSFALPLSKTEHGSKIALIDDDPVVGLEWRTESNGVHIVQFLQPEVFLRQATLAFVQEFEFVVIDQNFKGSDLMGTVVAKKILEVDPSVKIVLMSDGTIVDADCPIVPKRPYTLEEMRAFRIFGPRRT